jgi:Uma2 family endonuclease
MATQTPPVAALHRLDTETYNQIVEAGFLEGQPVELIDGFLVEHMSPQGPAHSALIERLTRHLAGARDCWLRVQLPLEVPPNSEPEPDLALVDRESSPERHARTARLTVEVAVGSHKLDRGSKLEVYARAGVPTYWVVDVPARAIEVYSGPREGGYSDHEVYDGPGARVPSPAPGVAELDLDALFSGVGG